MLRNYQITINGQVQGVGFRPYIYILAEKFGLKGHVTNNAQGVFIEVLGEESTVRDFYAEIIENPPPVSRIQGHHLKPVEAKEFQTFSIVPTQKESELNLQLTPDFAICERCKEEISDPENRRYQYPFTTCVNCGPRWSITNTFPFERAHTSMHSFAMCSSCDTEYTDPMNRRFHSQTNTCQTCGISLVLSKSGTEQAILKDGAIFKEVALQISKGSIVAVKNTGGYLLCCDACNPVTVNRLRVLKKRPTKPFAVLYPDFDSLETEFAIDESQKKVLKSVEKPIVILSKSGSQTQLALSEIAPKLNQIGVMLPYTGILELLAHELNGPIVATSGNLHGSPIIDKEDQALEHLSDIADYFVHHNMEISNAQDDSVVKLSFKHRQPVMFRRSRGFAPNFFGSDFNLQHRVMAMGADLKSSIAFVPNNYLYLSQYLGNLNHYDVYQRFVKTGQYFINLFEREPDVILVDQHPAYFSTIYGAEMASELGCDVIGVQHHQAHFAAVLGENELFRQKQNVLGVVWDGTGFGADEQIWGGEFFLYGDSKMSRLGHLDYFDWIAGDKMAKEPRLSALSLSDGNQRVFKKFSENEQRVMTALKSRNRLKTSSMGRLFDAVSSYLNLCDFNSYEGEAAIVMENAIESYHLNHVSSYCRLNENLNIPTDVLWKNLCADFDQSQNKEQTIINFLYTLCQMILAAAEKLELRKIALSGGVFQNTTLIDMLKELAENRFELYFNRNLAPNDENISYGQIMYYLNCQKN